MYLRVANVAPDIPYPTPADRKDLEKIVKANWNAKVQVPLAQTSEAASDHLSNVKEWIFDRCVPIKPLSWDLPN